MNIGFLCDIPLSNYLTNPEEYAYLHGRHSSTGYYYWILKNANVDNVSMVGPGDDLTKFDVIVFHYDNKEYIDHGAYKTIQVVTDRPCVKGCDLYIAANENITSPRLSRESITRYGIENTTNTWIDNKDQWVFIHYPPTHNIKKCDPMWPPVNYKFVGRRHTLIHELSDSKYIDDMKALGINIIIDNDNDNNVGDEHVYFCIRPVTARSKSTGLDNNSGRYGHKTANRLYQTWYMEVPGIFNASPEMMKLRDDELDFLIANDVDEFTTQAIRLREDKELYYNMVERCKKRQQNNPYADMSIVVNQWIHAFKLLNI